MPATQFDSGEFPIPLSLPYSLPATAMDSAQAFAVALERMLRPRRAFRLVDPDGNAIEIPEPVFKMIRDIATVLARGDSLTVVPMGKQLTTQQAAGLLNVSRQYLVRLLDSGEIPFERTGSHRRLRIEDVLTYRERRALQRRAALDQLAQLTQELGGYDDQGPTR